MSRTTRRSFLKQSAALGAAVALPYLVPQRAFGANDRINIALAGIHARGLEHIGFFAALEGCRITHLVDPDSRLFAARAAVVEEKWGVAPRCIQDIRRALEDPSVDVVSIATCNHWHSLMAIWACQHGKDVYLEKPCSHNVWEGRKCVEAARKYKRIVQHGTQSRSVPFEAATVAAVRSGKFGKLLVAKTYCCKPRWSIGFKPIKTPPPEVNFDLWLGPAPKLEYHENLVHYNWHWFWETGNADLGNQGVHEIDVARWAFGDKLPKSVVSLGGRWVNTPDYKDQGVTPNMELNVFDFDGALMVCETRGLVARTDKNGKVSPPVPNPLPTKVANEFYVEGGMITAGNFYPLRGGAPVPIENAALKGNPAEHPEPHFRNFLDCVRSRKSEDLHAEILQGHLSAALCHLGNISYRLGKPAAISRQPEGFPENEQVAASLAAIEKNLTQSLNLDLSKTVYQVGPKLNFDWKAEKFIGSPEADALLTRPARKPYAVPEEV